MLKTYRLYVCAALMAASVLLASCTQPQWQSFAPDNQEASFEKDFLTPGDDTQLPLRAWLPEGKPKALIVALHGFNDYSNAFTAPAQYLNRHGIAVFAYDQRGFGGSKSHGIWAGEENLTDDLTNMVLAAMKRYPGTPAYVMGESMGGAVAIAANARVDFPKIDGVILSAPAVWGDETMNAAYRALLWLMAHTVPEEPVTGSDLKILASDNIEMLRAMGRDPLVIKKTRIDSVYGIVKLMDSAFYKIEQVKTPILFLYGANDQVIPRSPIKRALQRIGTKYRAVYYPYGYHMLLRDLKAKIVLDDIIAWIARPDAELPSGFEKDARKELMQSDVLSTSPETDNRPSILRKRR